MKKLTGIRTRPIGSEISLRIVVDGFERLVAGVEDDARRIVEEKYADQLKSAGFFRRRKLRREIEREIAVLCHKMMPDVSPESLF